MTYDNVLSIDTVTAKLRAAANQFNIHTVLEFMEEHRGLRFGKIHLLLGSTGCGKSTLVRTMLLDCILGSQDIRTGIYLSEETLTDFYVEFSTNELDDYTKQKLSVISEQDEPVKTGREFFKKLESLVEQKCRVIFIDNITTSRLYENSKPNQQGDIIDYLKRFATKHNVALVVVAHTAKGSISSNNRLIDIEDVRGSGALPNAAPIAWTIQRVDYCNLRATVVRVAKNRGYTVKHQWFLAVYHAKNKVFCTFKPVEFEKIKDIFKQRDKI